MALEDTSCMTLKVINLEAGCEAAEAMESKADLLASFKPLGKDDWVLRKP